MTTYKTVKKETSAEFTEKKSVFIGAVAPVWSEASATDFVASVRQRHGGASHNVYAYIIKDSNITRFSDDGEPSSTAGIPALSVLQKNGLVNVAAVVTRYFGGILLGAGGLVRAYSKAVSLALEASGVALYEAFTEFETSCGYVDYDRLAKFVKSEKIVLDSTVFEENIVLSLAVRAERFDKVKADIVDLSSGRAKVLATGERFFSEDL